MNLVPSPVNHKMSPSTDESAVVSGLSTLSHVVDWETDSLPPLISSFTVTISKPSLNQQRWLLPPRLGMTTGVGQQFRRPGMVGYDPHGARFCDPDCDRSLFSLLLPKPDSRPNQIAYKQRLRSLIKDYELHLQQYHIES
ncbi:hypothetical protein L2E82_08935 [Cichorium intybus]|uniref:Uncharacterized protein n=1 Tax=Cichorium intybus TaxID=13427 RepID=A0ACB9G788_CICIN|nr:hypothetical protein L2E82_08935 [Cichorium intybus]